MGYTEGDPKRLVEELMRQQLTRGTNIVRTEHGLVIQEDGPALVDFTGERPATGRDLNALVGWQDEEGDPHDDRYVKEY